MKTPLEGEFEGTKKYLWNWFVDKKDGKLVPLIEGSRIWDAALIDAGDYDGDGRSELVFMYSGYILDGYFLFDHEFKQVGDFGFNYN